MAQQTENSSPLRQTERGKQLYHCYCVLGQDGSDEELLTTLLTTDNSYFYSQNEARHLLGKDGRGRTSYDGEKAALMSYDIDGEFDPEVEKNTLQLLASTINMFLADKQGPLDLDRRKDQSILNQVKVLAMQLISRGVLDLIEPMLNLPEYIKPEIESARVALEDAAHIAFTEFIDDIRDLGNEHLVDYVTGVGPAVFGASITSKAGTTYDNYFEQYKHTIKNPSEFKSRFLLRRDQYRNYTVAIKKNKLYELFDLTANQFNKIQRSLIDAFQELFNSDESLLYIQKLIIGEDNGE